MRGLRKSRGLSLHRFSGRPKIALRAFKTVTWFIHMNREESIVCDNKFCIIDNRQKGE